MGGGEREKGDKVRACKAAGHIFVPINPGGIVWERRLKGETNQSSWLLTLQAQKRTITGKEGKKVVDDSELKTRGRERDMGNKGGAST